MVAVWYAFILGAVGTARLRPPGAGTSALRPARLPYSMSRRGSVAPGIAAALLYQFPIMDLSVPRSFRRECLRQARGLWEGGTGSDFAAS